MVKFSVPANQRDAYQGYKAGTPFDDNKRRSKRVADRKWRKQRNKFFARKRKEEAKREAEVIKALQQKDEVELAAIATSVALFALTL